jgi:hypothetical protein
MNRHLISLAAIAAATLASASFAAAASQCAPHESISKQLTERFGEGRKQLGLADATTVVELYVSKRGTWTLVATNTQGRSCILGAGEAWQESPDKIAGLDS